MDVSGGLLSWRTLEGAELSVPVEKVQQVDVLPDLVRVHTLDGPSEVDADSANLRAVVADLGAAGVEVVSG